ncbi:hypothetical protein [Kitasatospora viridis]|uniref:Uncharacterized protein n=1 Tax=Kitasatospora viridis TaxID=281105 RepID=A0A561SA80_9ACTN|nr:hypothetical protein [Kitasatospora viridis]TWF71788.1 hypothetical protein FHX73_18159 [Kitasatospora viridis]
MTTESFDTAIDPYAFSKTDWARLGREITSDYPSQYDNREALAHAIDATSDQVSALLEGRVSRHPYASPQNLMPLLPNIDRALQWGRGTSLRILDRPVKVVTEPEPVSTGGPTSSPGLWEHLTQEQADADLTRLATLPFPANRAELRAQISSIADLYITALQQLHGLGVPAEALEHACDTVAGAFADTVRAIATPADEQ